MRSILMLLTVLGALTVLAPMASAEAAPEQVDQTPVMFVPDPYLDLATVKTMAPMARQCSCFIIMGCSYEPLGLDCAEPAGCCHCAGVVPALRQCVGN